MAIIWAVAPIAAPRVRSIPAAHFRARFPRQKWRLLGSSPDASAADLLDLLRYSPQVDLDNAELVALVTALTDFSTPANIRLSAAEAAAILADG